MKKSYVLLLICFATLSLHAQWTNNTTQNTLVANANASDIQTANTNDGRTWIAFYSQRGNNYDMRAQLLDAGGKRLLGDSGVLVSNRKSGSATFVFNVCVDNNNNFIIAFQYQKGTVYQTIIQKINTGGLLLWSNGVELGAGLSPYPVALSTNEIAVAWGNDNKIYYQKLSTAGVLVWSPYKQLSGAASVSRPQLSAGTDGRFNMVYQTQISFPFYTNLYEQKFDNNGNNLWSNSVKLSTLTTVSYRYYDVHQEQDTTYIGYYGNPSGSSRFDAYVQRVNPGGSLPYGIDGSAFSDYSGNNDPYEQTIYIAKQSGTNDVWAVCTVTNPFQTSSTVYAQKFNALTGSRYLGNNAKALAPLSNRLISLAFSKLSLCSNQPLFLITDNSNKLAAIKLNSNGGYAWNNAITPIGTSNNVKFRYGFTDVYDGQAVAVWQEDKGNGEKPYAQNITCGGNTGVATSAATNNAALLPNTFSINSIYPNPVQQVLTATVTSSVQGSFHVYITDVSGNILQQYQQVIQSGDNTIQLNVSNVKSGTYFMKVMNRNVTAAIMFSKQ